MSLDGLRAFWAVLFLIMILAAFIIPFTPLMSNLNSIYGAFFFWNLFAIIVIICLGIITARWGDDHER